MEKKYLTSHSYRPVKLIFAIILVFLCTWINPQSVFANGPKPANSIVINVINYPNQAVYVDLLIRMDPSEEQYVTFNENQGETYNIKRESEIVTYDDDGYLSYSFHFANAGSDLKLTKDKMNVFANDYDDFHYIYNHCRSIKVALLDSNGTIIAMSKDSKLKGLTDSYLIDGVITYDASQNRLEGIRNYQGFFRIFPILIFFFLITWIAPLLITISIESRIARKYKFNSIKTIVCLNIVTNLSLSFYITKVQAANLNYLSAVISGEILVYVIEFICLFLIYHKMVSYIRIAQYTVVANTASLLITVLFNEVGRYMIEHWL